MNNYKSIGIFILEKVKNCPNVTGRNTKIQCRYLYLEYSYGNK